MTSWRRSRRRCRSFFATTASAPSIAGEPCLPYGDAQRIPAALMLHGDAGALAGQASSIEQLNAAGIAVLTLDSFSGRGALATEPSLGSMPFRISGTTCVIDTDRALALPARHPRLDLTRIAVRGFSSDSTVFAAAQTRFAAPAAPRARVSPLTSRSIPTAPSS